MSPNKSQPLFFIILNLLFATHRCLAGYVPKATPRVVPLNEDPKIRQHKEQAFEKNVIIGVVVGVIGQ